MTKTQQHKVEQMRQGKLVYASLRDLDAFDKAGLKYHTGLYHPKRRGRGIQSAWMDRKNPRRKRKNCGCRYRRNKGRKRYSRRNL